MIEWRPKALEDFDELLTSLEAVQHGLAARAVIELDAIFERLDKRPLLARPSRYDGMREHSYRRHHRIIVFRITQNGIELVRILDTRMKPPPSVG